MIIDKTAKQEKNNFKPLYAFDSAREAFKQILRQYGGKETFTLLLPGYIGFSSNEGSGIYDPVIETGVIHKFYLLDRNLQIIYEDLEKNLKETAGIKLVLLVHYFGYPDLDINRIVALCRKYFAIIIEDAAHALYTDFVDHLCGNYGDYVFYSIHKMLPFTEGGLLRINYNKCELHLADQNHIKRDFFNYDFYLIAKQRKNNAKLWNSLLENFKDELFVIHPKVNAVTPQTFPIIIKKYNRNELYFRLNELGFGAVSLYHTMIEPILQAKMQDAIWVSEHIINLPVHQDIEEEQIVLMSKKLLEIING